MQIGLKNRSFIKKLLLQIHTLGALSVHLLYQVINGLSVKINCMKLMRRLTGATPAGLNCRIKNLYYCGDYLCKIAHKSKLNIGHSEYMYNEVVNEAKILSGR